MRSAAVAKQKRAKILYVINVDWFFFDHRLPVARKCLEEGYDVWVAAANTGREEEFKSYGFHFIPIAELEKGNTFFSEWKLMFSLYKLFKKIRPDILHNVTIRPVLYGSLLGRFMRLPAVVNELTGMGFVYISESWKVKLLRFIMNLLFRLGFGYKKSRLILQNGDDLDLVLQNRLVDESRAITLGGTGVNLERFPLKEEDPEGSTILYTGRLLWDKGLAELIEAADLLHQRGVKAEFQLFGAPYPANPQSIPEEILEQWSQKPNVNIHGFEKEILGKIEKSNIVCLPSYREGLPKTLLEGAAVGRALVTTDVPGCRELVISGENGYLVPPRDAEALANSLETLLLDPKKRKAFGKNSRKLVESGFSEAMVVNATLNLYDSML